MIEAGPLPDPFAWPDGRRVASPAAWPERARAWREQIVDLVYGALPPPPTGVAVELLAESRVRRWPGAPRLRSYRVRAEGGDLPVTFGVKLFVPNAEEPVGAIAYGDGCWWNLEDEAVGRVLAQGLALAVFDRTELAADPPVSPPEPPLRRGGAHDAYPGRSFGALAAWAWGFHRCVDMLRTLPDIDPARIAVTGFSRGGKAALLAGATDERIALVHDHASGAGGSAAFRFVADGGETIAIAERFPHWFGPGLRAYVGREGELPFDQHCLWASISPRPRLSTYAVGDRWSNPEGMVQCAWAVAEVDRFLGRPGASSFHVRPGGHALTVDDWTVLLDFIGWRWQGLAPRARFGEHPYAHLRPDFSWRAPENEVGGLAPPEVPQDADSGRTA